MATEQVPPRCPACGTPAKRPHYPLELEVDLGWEPKPWWCLDCLNAKIRRARSEA